MPEPKDYVFTLRNCAELLDSEMRASEIDFRTFTQKGELGEIQEKRVMHYERILRKAHKNKEIVGYINFNNEKLALDIQSFFLWSQKYNYSFSSSALNTLKINLDQMAEEKAIWTFTKRFEKNNQRRVEDDKLKLLLKAPLWKLYEGFLILDNFTPTEKHSRDIACITSDERLNSLYKFARDACVTKALTSVKGGKLEPFKVKPKDLINWLIKLDEDLILLSHANKLINNKRNNTQEINPKVKSSYLKVIYGLVKKHYKKYDPNKSKNNETTLIQNAIEEAGLNITDKTVKKIVDESFGYGKENSEK